MTRYRSPAIHASEVTPRELFEQRRGVIKMGLLRDAEHGRSRSRS
ncbi:hypothetical protein [Halomonas tibetensis]|uniref:Uncharacterized protein n=1 Tax=Halomonas tibetensis TaxID=2259590 RepID=A0ABV7B6F4_9GAMM